MVLRVVTDTIRQSLSKCLSIYCDGIDVYLGFFCLNKQMKKEGVFVKINRVFNNNVVLAYQDDSEIVVFGKGIGFGKQHGDEIDKTKVEKIFTTTEKQTHSFENLFKEISNEYADLTFMIVKQAEADLGIEFDSSIYIAIMDHINYALIRAKQGLFVKNELLWEIKRTYKKEYEAALKTLSIISEQTKITLPQDEAGTIAIHYFNAEDPSHHIKESYRAVEIIQDIIKIIQYFFKIEFDENEMNFNRLMTHLRYFANNMLNGEIKEESNDGLPLFKQLKMQYPRTYDCVLKIRKYIKEKLEKDVSDEELMYLMIHIQRIVSKEFTKKGIMNYEL